MTTLLFPGRHILNTHFQEEYLSSILGQPLTARHFILNPPPSELTLDRLVFAITSSNQDHSRYNPLPFYVRAIGVDRFARQFREQQGIDCRIVGIPQFEPTSRFAEHTLKEIHEQTEGHLDLTPDNTVVLCSTPSLIEMYARLGFSILPAELLTLRPEQYKSKTPIQLVKDLAGKGPGWRDDIPFQNTISAASISLWNDFPEIPERIQRLYQDPLLTEEGSLTATRNYSTYALGMSNFAMVQLKYDDIRNAVRPGKIVDEGCADGALLVPLSQDFSDSDLIGIEITGEFLARCQERQRAGEYGGTYIHFHQRNLLDNIFEPNSIDTTVCNSTLHEIWSYGNREASVRDYLRKKFSQTRSGGRLIIRDVVGPENRDELVYLWCNRSDGSQNDIFREYADQEELAAHLQGLSTYARFQRFSGDFLREERTTGKRNLPPSVWHTEERIEGKYYFQIRLQDAVEFLTKKDYYDNWHSENHEEFAFWSFSEWKEALTQAGFRIIENPNYLQQGSRVYTNPWIVEQRWKGKAALYIKNESGLTLLEYPPTTMILVGEKR